MECIYEEESNQSPKGSPVKIDVTEIEGLAEILQDSEEFEFEEENEFLPKPGALNFDHQDFDFTNHFEVAKNFPEAENIEDRNKGTKKLNPAS